MLKNLSDVQGIPGAPPSARFFCATNVGDDEVTFSMQFCSLLFGLGAPFLPQLAEVGLSTPVPFATAFKDCACAVLHPPANCLQCKKLAIKKHRPL
jgi:hypothetical protein